MVNNVGQADGGIGVSARAAMTTQTPADKDRRPTIGLSRQSVSRD
jgi:hypothetical protein